MHIKAKKSLGQHFLKDNNVIRKMVNIEDLKGKNVLEIGPGKGILTKALLEAKSKVTAIELDERVIDFLKSEFCSYDDRISIIHGDILNMDIDSLFQGEKYVVVSNIPYYITGLILSLFLDSKHKPESMILLVQKEVAERVVARDGKESILSMAVKAYGIPELSFLVKRGCFEPAPNVDSAVLHIRNIRSIEENPKNISKISQESFLKCIKTGFSHKRKILYANLCNIYTRETVEKVWNKLELNRNIRAEDVNIDIWFKIASELHKNS
jgi:16S rRNA (adenine1518-N6/adenine1519-N6)-dimethyltransferase